MFNIGFGELVFILSVALLILGPRKLPELARGLGRFLREFRRQTEEVRSVVEREFYKMDQELEAPLPKLAPPEGTRSIPPLHEAHAIPAAALAGAEGDDAQAPDAAASPTSAGRIPPASRSPGASRTPRSRADPWRAKRLLRPRPPPRRQGRCRGERRLRPALRRPRPVRRERRLRPRHPEGRRVMSSQVANANLPREEEPEDEDGIRMSLADHLGELRTRLMKVALAVGVMGAASLAFAKPLFGLLMQPVLEALPEDSRALIYTSGIEELNVLMKVGMYVGIFLATPVLLWQLWGFVAPGLYETERRLASPFVVSGTLAFVAGLAFCYFAVLPPMFRFLLNEGDSAQLEERLEYGRAQEEDALRFVRLGAVERAGRLAREASLGLTASGDGTIDPIAPEALTPARSVEVRERLDGLGRLLDASAAGLPASARPKLLQVLDKRVEAAQAHARGAHDAAAIALDEAAGLLGGAVGQGEELSVLWKLEKDLATGRARYEAQRWTRPMLTMKEQLSLVLVLLLAFGVIFELPLVMAVLGAVGLVSSKFLFRYQRHALVVCLILAAVLTPTGDIVNLSLMGGPMMLCYELGVLAVWLIEKRRKPEDGRAPRVRLSGATPRFRPCRASSASFPDVPGDCAPTSATSRRC